MVVDLRALFRDTINFPWHLTPFDRPSNVVPLYSILSRVVATLSKDHRVKSFYGGNPSWTEIVRRAQNGDRDAEMLIMYPPDMYDQDGTHTLNFLYNHGEFCADLHKRVCELYRNGRIQLPDSIILEKD